ncbi:histidine phosphatase family protein [Streptomyces sp. DSM 44915]|uniref:Histidine phosphatase family protein n=1 Tax=Streptomyces chisholmiae TaxID=3075540 RepID=A0ABU2JKI2_9ACTN|nr:histidine phosphatase family protein [Streptomyces sp. DSM 44915]MDT0265209.1 histidine phosphatase family protein [Streptomyces sp. DSM 44915]
MSVEVARRIVLLRHAKADWPEVADHERPLTERGRQDAHLAGRWLAGAGVRPELTLCSTAVRARDTWKLCATELPHRPRTSYEERLYESSPGEVIAVLNELDDAVRDVLVVGHNPTLHGLADVLAGTAEGDTRARLHATGFPTAAQAVLSLTGDWKSVEPGVAHLATFWTPHP